MNRSDANLPFRQANRLINAFQSDVTSIGLQVVGHDLARLATLLMIHRATLRDPTDHRIRPHAIAASLKRPQETIRRAAFSLADDGFARREARGLARQRDFLDLPAIRESMRRYVERFDRLLAEFRRDGFTLPGDPGAGTEQAKVAAALDIYLAIFELSDTRLAHLVTLYVVGNVSVVNASGITHDAVLARRYARQDTVPPDTLRRPATLATLVAIDGFPRTTLWRHLRAAHASGALRLVDGGYLLGDAYMTDPVANARFRAEIRYVGRVLQALAATVANKVVEPSTAAPSFQNGG